MWPVDADSLLTVQETLGAASPQPWRWPEGGPLVGGCWVCFPRGLGGRGRAGDAAWAAAVTMAGEAVVDHEVVSSTAGAPYVQGLLALRLGPLLEQVVRRLAVRPDVLLVDASGRDHPRRAGLAVHLGAVLDMATVGVTHRPLVAEGDWPAEETHATSPLRVGDEVVGCWMRTRSGTRPLAVHPGWGTSLATAVEVVAATTVRRRTPEPLRRARELARNARAESSGR